MRLPSWGRSSDSRLATSSWTASSPRSASASDRVTTRTPRSRDPLDDLGRAILSLLGRPWSDQERGRFTQYLQLIMTWNRVQRLTGHRSPPEIVRDLFQDSLLFLTKLPPGAIAVVDIGAGAGIPGVPLKIVRPELSLHLIEAKRKRVSFLATVKR